MMNERLSGQPNDCLLEINLGKRCESIHSSHTNRKSQIVNTKSKPKTKARKRCSIAQFVHYIRDEPLASFLPAIVMQIATGSVSSLRRKRQLKHAPIWRLNAVVLGAFSRLTKLIYSARWKCFQGSVDLGPIYRSRPIALGLVRNRK